jgi:hypothetical protein
MLKALVSTVMQHARQLIPNVDVFVVNFKFFE